jgi:leucyl-tRNA synthetase
MKTHLYAWIRESGFVYLKFDKKFMKNQKDFVNFLIDIGFEEGDAVRIFSTYKEIFLLGNDIHDWFDSQKTRGLRYYLVIGDRTAHIIFEGQKLESVNRFLEKYFTMVSEKKIRKEKTVKNKVVKKKRRKTVKKISKKKKR